MRSTIAWAVTLLILWTIPLIRPGIAQIGGGGGTTTFTTSNTHHVTTVDATSTVQLVGYQV